MSSVEDDDGRYRPIADYGFISDCHSTALVSIEGSIDWACLRRFDAGSAFGRLLDADRGGSFSIRPVAEIDRTVRRYLPSTMVLETTMSTADAMIRLTDAFAMRRGGAIRPRHELLRRVECIEGALDVAVSVDARFDYGSAIPWIRRHGTGRFSAVAGDDAFALHTDADLQLDSDRARLDAVARMAAGDELTFSLVSQPAHLMDAEAPECSRVAAHLRTTRRWWTEWSKDTTVEGPHAETLERSALVLKALTCAPTGAIVAAPTTSLPEVPGGSANWDYRYSWIRDASLAIESLAEIGHHEVASGFRDFVMRSAAGRGATLQIMFGPYGERSLAERELDLEGWRGSAPVRVGNAAAGQLQLDVYGHLLEAMHCWHVRSHRIDDDEWRFLSSVVDEAADRRDDPDAGLWELRGEPQHFVHSKVMIWVALDRGIRLVEDHGFECASVDRWREARDALRDDVLDRGTDPARGTFVQHYGTAAVDASLLRLPLLGFVDASDELMVRTTDVIMEELAVPPHGFLLRFRRSAGPPSGQEEPGEGVFLLCSCWLVEVLALQGRVDEATLLFDALLGVGNDLGLFPEEATPDGTGMLGNFPQAFTHLGLIRAERRLRTARAV